MGETYVHQRENIEWSIHYAYNARNTAGPRVLLIGDSICNAYHGAVRRLLEGRADVSFWASSRCVTDPDYFRELEFVLDYVPYRLICFNNGLHSLSTERGAWERAFGAALDFIRDTCPDAHLAVTLSTPLKDPKLTAASTALNEIAVRAAQERELPVIDLFSAMDPLDRETYWTDTYHFAESAVEIQADVIAAHVLETLGLQNAAATLAHVSTETGPCGRLE